MNYTLSQLEIFCSVVEMGSVTEAADKLSLTQPAVSIQLKNFQKQFQQPLYEIIQQRFQLTDYGSEIYQNALPILEQVSQFNLKLRWPKDTLIGKIRFSVVSTGKYIAPFLISQFVELEPAVTWQLDVSNKSQVVQALEQQKVDLTLMSILPYHLEIDYIRLMPNQLYLVGKRSLQELQSQVLDFESFVTKNATYNPKILEKLPLILRESGSGTRTIMEEFILKHQLRVNAPFELTSNEAVKQAVMAGLGYSIMPLIGIKQELEMGLLQVIPVDGLPLSTFWYVVWLKQKKLNPATTVFLEFLKVNSHNTEEEFL